MAASGQQLVSCAQVLPQCLGLSKVFPRKLLLILLATWSPSPLRLLGAFDLPTSESSSTSQMKDLEPPDLPRPPPECLSLFLSSRAFYFGAVQSPSDSVSFKGSAFFLPLAPGTSSSKCFTFHSFKQAPTSSTRTKAIFWMWTIGSPPAFLLQVLKGFLHTWWKLHLLSFVFKPVLVVGVSDGYVFKM